MSTLLQIYFIRHGETAWSLNGRHTGRTDLPLTAHGQATACELAAALAGISFSSVLTSPRLRARATCELAGLAASAQVEQDLSEWNYGDYEGLRTVEIQRLHAGLERVARRLPVRRDACGHQRSRRHAHRPLVWFDRQSRPLLARSVRARAGGPLDRLIGQPRATLRARSGIDRDTRLRKQSPAKAGDFVVERCEPG